MCRVLREALAEGVRAGRGAAGGIGSIQFRACAAVYWLLLDHPVDRRGRCRSCRRHGALVGARWRRCRVSGTASLWLEQLDELLLPRLLPHELSLGAVAAPAAPGRAPARDPEDTDVLPAIAAEAPTQLSQTPVVPPPPAQGFPRAGRPDPDHGGTGDDPLMASGLAVAHPKIRPATRAGRWSVPEA
jgi:hypothetical protein